jgi:hypothetical protein
MERLERSDPYGRLADDLSHPVGQLGMDPIVDPEPLTPIQDQPDLPQRGQVA